MEVLVTRKGEAPPDTWGGDSNVQLEQMKSDSLKDKLP